MNRPTVTYQGGEKPFSMQTPVPQIGGQPMVAIMPLSRSEARSLRLDIERAEQEAAEVNTCEGNRHEYRIAEAQPLGLRQGEVAVSCHHCPTEGTIDLQGDFVPAHLAEAAAAVTRVSKDQLRAELAEAKAAEAEYLEEIARLRARLEGVQS